MNEGMLTMKKLFALMLALAMMLTVVCAFAENAGGEGGQGQGTGETTNPPASNSTPSITIKTTSKTAEAERDETAYTWYRILDADIGNDPSINDVYQSGGRVSYHVETVARANIIGSIKIPGTDTNMFKLTQISSTDTYSVELTNPDNTTGAQIAEALGTIDLTQFPSGTFSQEEVAGTATSGTVAPGYYYIKSTAGKNVALQTLTAVTITEKNEFPTVTKEVPEKEKDRNAQIGDEITFNMTVTVPVTANDKIVLNDTMTAGLSYKEITSIKIGEELVDAANYTVTPAEGNSGFTLTLPKELVISWTAEADSGTNKTEVDIVYKATLNGAAKTDPAEKNTVVLKYGDNYDTIPKEATVKTYDVEFDKVDGSNGNPLAGAEFNLKLNGTVVPVIEVVAGKEYRIAMPNEEGATPTIQTIGETVRIYGLDIDVNTYSLQETKAPTGGYNILKDATPIRVNEEGTAFTPLTIENNEGAVLPSTGGSGTMIFYVVGGLLIIGAAIVLVARRKAHE